MVEVWGLAVGWRSTKGAARGAFTVREYPDAKTAKEAERDWLKILVMSDEADAAA